MRDRLIDSPIPRPCGFVVKKGSNRWSASGSRKPTPASSTVTTAQGPSSMVSRAARTTSRRSLGRDVAHGLGRVDEQVEEDLLELDPIAEDRRQVRGQRRLQGDAVTVELGTDEGQHVADDRGELAGLPGRSPSAPTWRESDEHLRRAVAVVHDCGEGLAHLVEGRGSASSQWRQALASATMAARGWLISCAIEAASSAEGRHARDVGELGAGLVQGRLGPLALGDVVVRLENRQDPPVGAAPQGPAAGHHDRRPIAPRVDELTLPAPRASQLGHDLVERGGEDRPRAGVRHGADGLRLRPPVELFRTAVPVGDDVVLVANEDGVVRQIEERRLLTERFFRSCSRGDLRAKLRVAAREVRRSRLDPDLQLIARQPERILHAAAPDAQPADEECRQREDGDAQERSRSPG